MTIAELKYKILKLSADKGISLKFSLEFDKQLKKIADNNTKIKIYKHILKIIENPDVGKFMRYSRKGEQENYLDSFRLYYKYYKDEKILRFIEFSHKDEQ
ncbi:MAG: hypothetical protein V1859_00930 [archaeon]